MEITAGAEFHHDRGVAGEVIQLIPVGRIAGGAKQAKFGAGNRTQNSGDPGTELYLRNPSVEEGSVRVNYSRCP
jgi:hypothetical protein